MHTLRECITYALISSSWFLHVLLCPLLLPEHVVFRCLSYTGWIGELEAKKQIKHDSDSEAKIGEVGGGTKKKLKELEEEENVYSSCKKRQVFMIRSCNTIL